jgi:DNA-3-methyladenine glycosylase II
MRSRAGETAFAVSIARAGRRAPAAQRHGGEHDSHAVQKTFSRQEVSAPEDLAKVTDAQIRACGFSFAKIKSIRDIAEKTLSGVIPGSRQIVKLSDDEIVARLTEVRGVGRWTVEMLLIFQLGRHDVLPADDFGVRTGFRVAYKKGGMPTTKELLAFGEKWRPHRTTAAWFLWRAADGAKKKK